MCDCEIDFWGALPHKHPLSSLKAGPAEEQVHTGASSPTRSTHFMILPGTLFKKIAQMNSSRHAGYATGCFKRSNAQSALIVWGTLRAGESNVVLQGGLNWYISAVNFTVECFKVSIFKLCNYYSSKLIQECLNCWHIKRHILKF